MARRRRIKRIVSRSRRSFKRRSIPGKRFTRKVFDVISRTSQITDDVATVIRTATTGKALVSIPAVTLSQVQHQLIQGRLNTDELSDTSVRKNYYLRSCLNRYIYTNSSAAKVTVKIYKYRARFDYNNVPGTLYQNGFTADTNILFDDVNATPYMSPQFCSFNKIVSSYSKTLEQGESITVNCRVSNKTINKDRYNSALTVGGSVGHIMIATSTLGYDTVLAAVTTGQVELMVRTMTQIQFKQMADNTVNSYKNGTLPNVGLPGNFRFANSDSGGATAGIAGDVVP